MTVCFCGHSKYGLIKEKCYEIVQTLIEKGADSFLIGDYGDFDAIATSVCLTLKREYPHIEVCLILPYYRPHIDDYTQQRYNRFDSVITPALEDTPYRYRIVKANQYMVDQADILIAYVRSGGGAANTMEYAKKKLKKVFNLSILFSKKIND